MPKQPRVTRQDIDAVAIPVIDAVVFQMTDALTRKNLDKAFSVLGDLLRLQQAPIKILAVLGKQLRQLYSARVALESGQGEPVAHGPVGMRSSYPAEKSWGARHHGLDWCKKGHASVRRDRPGHEVGLRGRRQGPAGLPGAGAGGGRHGMLKIQEAIVVEGRYDKNTVSQVVDTVILETGGALAFSRTGRPWPSCGGWGEKRGLIVLTDSDGAGFVIRNRIKALCPRTR